MKLEFNPIEESCLFYQPKDLAFVSIVETFDKIKSKIGINKIAYGSEIKNSVENVILGAMFLPYELSADYVQNGDEHIDNMISLLQKLKMNRHKLN